MVDQTPVTAAGLDPESAWWLGMLAGTGPRREAALARLHAEDWDRLPDQFGLDPAQQAEWRDLAAALRRG